MSAMFRTADRVGLQDYELEGWIERLRSDKRCGERVADELARAVEAAVRAGLVIPGATFAVSRASSVAGTDTA